MLGTPSRSRLFCTTPQARPDAKPTIADGMINRHKSLSLTELHRFPRVYVEVLQVFKHVKMEDIQ